MGGRHRDAIAFAIPPIARIPSMSHSSVPVSAVIVCFNEQELIGECLESVAFCDEIVIVDSGSTDRTIEIIEDFRSKGYPIRLIHRAWTGYASQKQFALEHATMPWLMVVDADEQIDADLRESIREIVQDDGSPISAWQVRRRDWLAGYGLAHPYVLHNRILRLFRNGKVRIDPEITIHEMFIVDGPTSLIRSGLLLHMRDLSLEDDVARANAYSTQKSSLRANQRVSPSTTRLFLTPPYTFIKFYFLKRYFLCGRPGFIYSMMMMFYSFLTEAKIFRSSLKDDD